MLAKNKRDFEKYFRSEVMPELRKVETKYGNMHIDYPLRREGWNNMIDALIKDRQLPCRAENWCCPW